MTHASETELNQNYQKLVGRKTELLLKHFRAIQSEDHYQEVINNGKKKLILRWLLKPEEILVSDGKCKGMRFS